MLGYYGRDNYGGLSQHSATAHLDSDCRRRYDCVDGRGMQYTFDFRVSIARRNNARICLQPEFSMMAFVCAMLSNVLFATRGVLSKPLMKTMSGSDLFAVNTFFAFIIMAPVTFALEGGVIVDGLS